MTFGAPSVETTQVEWGDAIPQDAAPPDDDFKWRTNLPPPSIADEKQAKLHRCEASLQRAMKKNRPSTLLRSILANNCTAIKSEKSCARCRICPSEDKWAAVNGYYNATKARVTICADKELSDQQVEDTLTHELVHAYDHCRFSKSIPMVGRQHPWALTGPATACSEVRAYLLGNAWKGSTFSQFSFGSSTNAFGESPWSMPATESSSSAESYTTRSAAFDDSPHGAAEEQRNQIYASALHSLENYGPHASSPGEARTHLDKVFYACLADFAPFASSQATDVFPSMPPEAQE